MKIVLIGFMGSGKTSVAKALGERLRVPCVEMDDQIIKASGRSSIIEIFESDGEPRFRSLESEIARSLSSLSDVVISTGGGAIFGEGNIDSLRANNGKLILLDTSFSEVMKRIGNETNRPLLKDPEATKALYSIRRDRYLAAADIVISTDGKTVEEVVCEVIASVSSNSQH